MRVAHRALAAWLAILGVLPIAALAQLPTSDQVLSADRAAFARLNEFRRLMSVRPLRWHPLMSMNAKAHAHYLQRHPAHRGHYEDKSQPGYSRRGEAGARGLIAHTGDPDKGLHQLINSVYHRLPLIDPQATDVGIGHSQNATVMDVVKVRPESPSYSPRINDNRVSVYPIPDQTGVPTTFAGETPDPIPRTDKDRKTGSPITITWPPLVACREQRDFQTLAVTLTEGASGEIPVHLVMPSVYAPDTLAVLAQDPFKPGTAYRIAIRLQPKSGSTMTLDWAFRTATGAEKPSGGPYRFSYNAKPQLPTKPVERIAYWQLRPDHLPADLGALAPLKVLQLGACQLAKLDEAIGHLSHLEELALPYNRLNSLPASLGRLSNLWHLDLSCNQLAALPPEIGKLPALTRIWLVDNQLDQLPASWAAAKSLELLDAAFNRLVALPASLLALDQLQTLQVGHNALQSLPPFGAKSSDLRELLVCSNRLKTLPESLQRLKALQKLDVSHNLLTALPAGLNQLTGLKELYAGDNQLGTLPEGLGHLQSLVVLDLSHNNVARLPEAIGQLSALTALDLSYNRLSRLPADLEKLGKLDTLILVGNPLPAAEVQALQRQLPKVAILF